MAGDRGHGLHRPDLGPPLWQVRGEPIRADPLSLARFWIRLISRLLCSLLDCFLVAVAPVSVSMSPTGDFLATAHVDHLGVYLWSEPITALLPSVECLQPITAVSSFRTNKSLCGPVGLRPLPADYQPAEETIPGVTAEEEEQEVTSEEADDEYQSAEQLGAELVTLSLLPESRWKSLLHLDDIKVV